jgi:hypothetical protein
MLHRRSSIKRIIIALYIDIARLHTSIVLLDSLLFALSVARIRVETSQLNRVPWIVRIFAGGLLIRFDSGVFYANHSSRMAQLSRWLFPSKELVEASSIFRQLEPVIDNPTRKTPF